MSGAFQTERGIARHTQGKIRKKEKNTKPRGNARRAHVVGIRGEKLMSLPHTPTGWVHGRGKNR